MNTYNNKTLIEASRKINAFLQEGRLTLFKNCDFLSEVAQYQYQHKQPIGYKKDEFIGISLSELDAIEKDLLWIAPDDRCKS
jgi:siroheme synthase (precorrin-2 oxidase/ferrochelatase)